MNIHGYQNSYVVTTNDTVAPTYVSTTSSGWGLFNWRAEPRDHRDGSAQTLVIIMPPYLAVNILERTS